jgi:di- and tripeptidase
MHPEAGDSDDPSDNESPLSLSPSNASGGQLQSFSEQLSMQNDCAIGHRVQASRSILALALDEDFVFAGLQGGDIVVCTPFNWQLSGIY